MMKKYNEATIELISLSVADVITTSAIGVGSRMGWGDVTDDEGEE